MKKITGILTALICLCLTSVISLSLACASAVKQDRGPEPGLATATEEDLMPAPAEPDWLPEAPEAEKMQEAAPEDFLQEKELFDELVMKKADDFTGAEPESATTAMRSDEQEEPSLAVAKPQEEGDQGSQPELDAARQLASRADYRTKAPQMLARINGTDLEPLPLVVNDIYVVIAGHRARVIYDLVYRNPVMTELAGTLMIELPDGGSPCYLGMFQGSGTAAEPDSPGSLPGMILNPSPVQLEQLLSPYPQFAADWKTQQQSLQWGELRSARVVNPIQGKEVYESVTRRRVDPALAEWAGGNKFSTRIYPVTGNSYKRILFAYDRPLKTEADQLLYTLPLPADLTAETRVQIYTVGDPFKTARLLAGTEEITVMESTAGKRWRFKPDKTFTGNLIFYGEPHNPDLQILSGSDGQIPGKLVHLRYRPQLPAGITTRSTGKALFLLDTSYSTKDKLYSFSGKMLRAILEQDASIREFAVICFDVVPRPLADYFQANTPANRDKLLDQVEKIWLEGATNFSALLGNLEQSALFAGAESIFLLSDGQITWGNDNTRELETRFRSVLEKPWFCYSFGELAVNNTLFSLLSRQGGQQIHVGAGQDLRQAAAAHRKSLTSLDYIRINNGEDLLVAGDPVNLYPGQVLDLAARVADFAEELDFTISISGAVQQIKVPLAENPLSRMLAARAWAELYITRLLELYDEDADEAVLALSQHFSLTNRQASFIILETDEEYEEHAIREQMFSLAQILNLVKNKLNSRPYGAPDLSGLLPETRELLTALGSLQSVAIYQSREAVRLSSEIRGIMSQPPGRRDKDFPAELYAWAREIHEQNRQVSSAMDQAYRILSTIIEEKPRDDTGARLVGYVLLEWCMYREAAELFAGIRQRRPFEPQNYLIEGLALALQGKAAEAAACYELVLQGQFDRFDSFVKPVAELFYTDLLRVICGQYPSAQLAVLCRDRLKQLSQDEYARGRLVLFWNLDDTDVDLHVLEADRYEVYYSDPESPSGGRLHWDNTTGLGPELYSHPTLADKGFEVFVNYFGTSSVEGMAPSATLVCAFRYSKDGLAPEIACYSTVLAGADEDKVLIMPLWKR